MKRHFCGTDGAEPSVCAVKPALGGTEEAETLVGAGKRHFGGTEGTGTNVVKEVKGVGETNFLYNVCVFMVKIRKKTLQYSR